MPSAAFCAVLLLAAAPVTAAELRVDGANGDDSATYAEVAAGTATWATIGRAAWGSTDRNLPIPAQAAQPGDRITVAEGVYSTAYMSGTRLDPAWNPVNGADSASEVDRITFIADGLVELQGQVGEGGPIIGAQGRRYVTWQGFTIDEQYVDSRPDTGPVVVWASDFVSIVDCTILGDPEPLLHYQGGWDNHNGIRIENSNDVVIRGNYIAGFNHQGNGDPGRNATGITTYDSRRILIENNELTNNCSGAYIKASAQNTQTQEAVTLRYNLIHDNTQRGLQLNEMEGDASRVYQNVIYGNPVGVRIGGSGAPQNMDFINNTVEGDDVAILWSLGGPSQGSRYYNNIFARADIGLAHESADTSHLDSQHHCIFGHATEAQIAYEDHTLAQWQAATGQDQVAPATAVLDPLFVDAEGHDFHLQDTSPCAELAVDVLDLDLDGATDDLVPTGAYVLGDEVIGLGEGVAPEDPGGGSTGGSTGGGTGESGGVGTDGGDDGDTGGGTDDGPDSEGADSGTGDTPAQSTDDPTENADAGEDSGCSCRATRGRHGAQWSALVLLGLAGLRRRRARRAFCGE